MFTAPRRDLRRSLLVSIFVAAFLSPAALAAPAHANTAKANVAGSRDLVGVARMVHGDVFRGSTVHLKIDPHWEVDTGHGSVRVALPADAHVQPGDRVRVRGALHGASFVAAAGGVTNQGIDPSAVQATAVGTKRVAVVLVNFANDVSEPYTADAVRGVVFDNPDSVSAYYHDSTDGQLSVQGDVFDWYTIPSDNQWCNIGQWSQDALAEPGVGDGDYSNIVFAFPYLPSCPFSGLGEMPGAWTWINGEPTLRVVAHELGHNFGVHHANSLACTDANGAPVMLSSKCTNYEYGDPFSVMGGTTRLHNNWQRTQMGYLNSTQTVTESGDYTLAPSEVADASAPRLLRVPRGDGTYFQLEFRQPYGVFDNFLPFFWAVNGVEIRIAPDVGVLTQSLLIDCTPATLWWEDAPCVVGQTFVDPLSGLQIATQSVSAGGAVVRITVGPDIMAPTVPGNVHATPTGLRTIALSWSASTDYKGVAGYRIYRNGTLIKTVTATHYTDTGLVPNTNYKYTVAAFDAAGNPSAKSAVASATTRRDTQAPTAPGNPEAHAHSGIVVTWTASKDNVGVAGYRVFRNGVLLKQVKGTSFVDHPGPGTFTYTVAAYDAAKNVSVRSHGVRFKVKLG